MDIIETLPKYIVFYILSYLEPEMLPTVASINKKWNRVYVNRAVINTYHEKLCARIAEKYNIKNYIKLNSVSIESFRLKTLRSGNYTGNGALATDDYYYEGAIMDGKPFGHGVMYKKNGTRICAEFNQKGANGIETDDCLKFTTGTYNDNYNMKFNKDVLVDTPNKVSIHNHNNANIYGGKSVIELGRIKGTFSFDDYHLSTYGTISVGKTTYTGSFIGGKINGSGVMTTKSIVAMVNTVIGKFTGWQQIMSKSDHHLIRLRLEKEELVEFIGIIVNGGCVRVEKVPGRLIFTFNDTVIGVVKKKLIFDSSFEIMRFVAKALVFFKVSE